MTTLSPKAVYHNLSLLEQVDTVRSACYRQQAIEIISDEEVSLRWRQAIADRLVHANYLLAQVNVTSEDSY
ncbi:MAG: hypothetical protein EA367_06900 [Leptolyngbya sp. DLM2.Bin15]|uniref:hypothetical protein n=1 Tax=Leptolyngbya sp. CCY15150 TaxID=2767772 RepID=UPI00138303D6|nr:hypothetical protein [Leptolyngbya sp. CCY15150]TVQ21063.1 MAG: hypothetical protein EA367_06900 [Leptolyngbya sp. DLM2.Bin15]